MIPYQIHSAMLRNSKPGWTKLNRREIWKMIKEKLQENYKTPRNKFNMNGTWSIFMILNLGFMLKLPWGELKYSDGLRQKNKSEFLGVNSVHQHFLKLVSNSNEVLNSRVTGLYEDNCKNVLKGVKQNLKGTHCLWWESLISHHCSFS